MFFNTLCFLAPCLMMALAADPGSSTTSKPSVTIYYENLCPDSLKFFENFSKLYSTSNLNNSMILKLNPFGNTNVNTSANGTHQYACEHGASECYKNQIHACVIRNEANFTAVFNFVNCSFFKWYHNTSKNATEECAQASGINIASIYDCMNTTTGSQYYFEFGQDLKRVGVDVIPSVAFNNTYNKTLSSDAVMHFSDTFCSYVKTNNMSNEYCKSKENSATIPSVSLLTFVIASFLLVKMYQ